MPKYKSQSSQASICITINMKLFTRFPHKSTYLKQFKRKKWKKIRELQILKQRKPTSSEQNTSEKLELNAVVAKIERSLNNGSEN